MDSVKRVRIKDVAIRVLIRAYNLGKITNLSLLSINYG